ncbi:MAG: hypothetical protein EYC62_01650 [Alphaproteobacteria bacterium]|nr:MAG: hypothetical protein EYC62_01650 [Alphaproteobacteria bacterium]
MDKKILAPFLCAASFIGVSAAKGDLFLHSNFDIEPYYHSPYIPIPDLTNRNIGVGYGEFAAGSLSHSLSLGSSGNRASGYSQAGYSSIAPEFNQSWYGSFMNRFNAYDGGGVFLQFSPDANLSNHEYQMGIGVLPMGITMNYGENGTHILQRTPGLVDHFVLIQYSINDIGNSQLQLWIDPADTNNLGNPLISYNFTTLRPFNFFAISCWGSGPNDSFDELRFGTELSDVAVVPSPATLAPLLGLALAQRRRR